MIGSSDYRPHLLPKLRSDQLMAAMALFPCTLRIASFIPGATCAHQSTVVGAHLQVAGKGIGTKVTDMAVVAACATCHALQERRDPRIELIEARYPIAVTLRYAQALVETHTLLMMDGVLVVPDGNWI